MNAPSGTNPFAYSILSGNADGIQAPVHYLGRWAVRLTAASWSGRGVPAHCGDFEFVAHGFQFCHRGWTCDPQQSIFDI